MPIEGGVLEDELRGLSKKGCRALAALGKTAAGPRIARISRGVSPGATLREGRIFRNSAIRSTRS
jgi:hypothetical protein